MNAKALHEKAVEISKTYLRAEGQLIEILQTIDSMRAYRDLGFRSLYDYTIHALGLSEGVAYNLITVARKASEVPALKEKIQAQEMTLSNARMIAPVLTQENQEKWITAAQSLSKRELEKEIAKENPKLAVQETLRPVSAERAELRIGISGELERKLKRVQDLVSSKVKKAVNLEETLQALVDLYLEKEDPIEKAKRAAKPVPGQEKTDSSSPEKRRRLPAHIRHALVRRDGGQCSHRDSQGRRCTERRWIEFHHRRHVAWGGENTIENLTTLCRGHHQMIHRSS